MSKPGILTGKESPVVGILPEDEISYLLVTFFFLQYFGATIKSISKIKDSTSGLDYKRTRSVFIT